MSVAGLERMTMLFNFHYSDDQTNITRLDYDPPCTGKSTFCKLQITCSIEFMSGIKVKVQL